MDELAKKFATRIKMYNINCPAVYQCAMFRGILRNKGYLDAEIVQGYCMTEIMGKTGGACRHFWVRADGHDIDVLKYVSAKYTPELLLFTTHLVYGIAEGTIRVDANETEIVNKNESDYELFTKNVKEFWAQAPKSVRNARIKI